MWLRSIAQSSDTAPVTIVLNDDGRETTTDVVSDRLAGGEQVLALDLIFTGIPGKPRHLNLPRCWMLSATAPSV